MSTRWTLSAQSGRTAPSSSSSGRCPGRGTSARSPSSSPWPASLPGSTVACRRSCPTSGTGPLRKAVLYRADPGPFVAYRRTEVVGSPDEIVSLASQLLDSSGTSGRRNQRTSPDAELLICTHGSRDRCCGSLGRGWSSPWRTKAGPDGATRVRRTSHTGGHRFAPTAILLPEGTGWGYLDEGVLRRIVRRSGAVADVLPLYRGCAGLTSPRIQAVERAVLAAVGWGLFDCARQGSEEEDGTVRLTVAHPDGEQVWTAEVRTGRILPCRHVGRRSNPTGRRRRSSSSTTCDACVEWSLRGSVGRESGRGVVVDLAVRQPGQLIDEPDASRHLVPGERLAAPRTSTSSESRARPGWATTSAATACPNRSSGTPSTRQSSTRGDAGSPPPPRSGRPSPRPC